MEAWNAECKVLLQLIRQLSREQQLGVLAMVAGMRKMNEGTKKAANHSPLSS